MRVAASLLGYDGAYAFMIRKNPPFEGQLNLVGGRIEAGEDADHAIVREIREETGCEAQVKRIGTIDIRYDGRDPMPHTFYTAIAQDAPCTCEPSEGEIVLLTIEEALASPKVHPFIRRIIGVILAGEPFTGSARIGPGPEYQVLDFTLGTA
jgi:ADP-ribose pyrophosphatase YjhB (NUDIX family)